ncbi:MAG: thiolase family protein [Desertimonas sp.]
MSHGPATPPVAVTGLAELAPTATSDRTQLELLAAVARPAMLDAGLLPRAVDGLLVAPAMAGTPLTQPAMVAEYLGLTPSYCDAVDLGGATAAGMVWRAGAAIAAGACRHVLCVLAETVGPWATPRAFWKGLPRNEAETIYGQAGATSAYALAANRHAVEFGTTDEQRAAVLVAQRANAATNELALYRDPLTVDEVLAAPVISSPLRLFEIVRAVSGAAAFIVSSGATAVDLRHPPAWLRGFGERVSHNGIAQMDDLTRTPVADTAQRAMKMAGVASDEIDVAEVYDCFTITVILTLEDAGFCPKGGGGAFVEGADFGPASALPVNTNGGQLCMGQAGIAGGATHVLQAVRQLRHAAGDVQVPGCETAFVNGNGGLFGEQCSLVLGRSR